MWHIFAVVGLLLRFCSAAPPTPLGENSWAFLVAGSNSYMNYRHQADVCHAYHVMINEGVPAEHIIVMMYDDIAYNEDNLTPGVIINQPNGTNVYAGVKIDYKEKDVTPQNFLNVLSGNKKAMKGIGTGRVIESNEAHSIFVYFADHGGPGMLCFPEADLLAHNLENTLMSMRRKKQFKNFIMYVEACEAGSMFDGLLPEYDNIYVMTASARDESSFATYCDDDVCLGDEFSVRWLEHMDSEKSGTLEPFFHQYQHLRTAVKQSHPQIYGDFSLGPDDLTPNKNNPTITEDEPGDVVSINSMDVPLLYLRRKMERSNSLVDQRKVQETLDQLIESRKTGDRIFEEFVLAATPNSHKLRSTITNERLNLKREMFPCYEKLLRHFRKFCFSRQNEYFLKHFYKFTNMCLLNVDVEALLERMPSICEEHKKNVTVTVL